MTDEKSTVETPNPVSDSFKQIRIDSSKKAYDNIKFYPVSILDAAIVAFLGVGLVLAIIWQQTTLSATIAGVFGGYISKSAVTNVASKDSQSQK